MLSTTIIPISSGLALATVATLLFWGGIGWLVLRWLDVIPAGRRGQ
jgi:hypothetical protein